MTISFASQYVTPLWKATKSFSNKYANFVFGAEQSEVFSNELQKSVRGIKTPGVKGYKGGHGFTNLKGDLKSAWSESAKVVKGKSLWTTIKDSFKTIPEEFKGLGQEAKYLAKGKGALKILGKRMPLIGNLIFAAMEIPNIFKAFKEGGVGTGVAETLKSATKFGGFAAGAAVGQALIPIPFVGAMIGGFIGQWVTDKIVGKSFTEKKEEAVATETEKAPVAPQRKAAQAQYQQNPQAFEGQYAQQPVYTQQPAYAQAQYTNQVMPNQFGQNVYAQGASQAGAGSFDMNGDFLAQTSFGPSNNNMYAFNRQQQY